MKAICSFFKAHQKMLIRTLAVILPLLSLVGVLSQTVFAQVTYVITDGDQVTVHTTFASDPETVLDEAGLTLGKKDIYTTQETDGVAEITVQRAQSITVQYCGETLQLHSYGETLESLLSREGIDANLDFVSSQPMDTETYDGMEVWLDKIVERSETYTTEISYETTYYYDPTLVTGAEKVLKPGKTGQLLCTDNVIYCNGEETSRTNLEHRVLEQPQNQIIMVGTGAEKVEEKRQLQIGNGTIVLESGEVLTYTHSEQFSATAYTSTDDGCDLTTATGTHARVGVVAVDPEVIPYGTRMFIVTNDGAYIYGLSTAEDCGGGIQGNRLDLYFDTAAECWQFGVRDCTVYFLGDANW